METPKILIREKSYKQAYNSWKSGKERNHVISRVREFYELSILGEKSLECEVIQTPTYAMFIVHDQEDWDEDTYRFLMDYWREKVLGEGYTAYMSDQRRELLDGGIRLKIERHYLKPDVYEAMMKGLPINRRYGNVTLELVFFGEEVDYLKMTMGFYHERNKHREKGLENLMEVLLKG